MIERLLKYLEDKKILILGFGIEGESTYKFLRRNFPEKNLYIADKNINLLNNKIDLMEDPYVEVSLGEEYLNGIEEYDLIVKAPGISFKDVDITKFKDKITSQLELFLEYADVFSIGITGTKGKSTTSTLIYKVLLEQGKDVFLLGNIGEPIFNDIEDFTDKTIAVIEISSHALEYVKRSTNISILLDVFEEHLDHYKSLDAYIEAKFNIAKFQTEKDYFIYNYDNELMNKFGFKYRENDYAISISQVPNTKNKVTINGDYINCNGKDVMNIHEEMHLKGEHNLNNIMFIFALLDILKLDTKKAIETIKDFWPLEHRMEYFANIDGVDYYNDSIATIPEATINAIKSIKNVNTLLVGGNDRGVNLSELIEFLKECQVENIICLPKTGEYIYSELKDTDKNVMFYEKLEDAVKKAKEVTKKGTSCILSPAASSYGYFKNFEERGRLYKDYVINNN